MCWCFSCVWSYLIGIDTRVKLQYDEDPGDACVCGGYTCMGYTAALNMKCLL